MPTNGSSTRPNVILHPKLYAILIALAKESRGPVYRKHGGFLNNDHTRACLKSAIGDIERDDALPLIRGLEAHGVLNQGKFCAEKADAVLDACAAIDSSFTRGNKSIVEMCQRDSDPGPAPASALVATTARQEPVHTRPPFADEEDELLALRCEELGRKIEESNSELEAVKTEMARREKKRVLVNEILELETQLNDKRRALKAMEATG